jgi:hypothetical protein
MLESPAALAASTCEPKRFQKSSKLAESKSLRFTMIDPAFWTRR